MMNLQARLTESLKASQSALRVISQLESRLAEKEEQLSVAVEEYRALESGKIAKLQGKTIANLESRLAEKERVLLECRIWLDEDNIGPAYWTPLYRDFRKRLDAALQDDDGEGKQ